MKNIKLVIPITIISSGGLILCASLLKIRNHILEKTKIKFRKTISYIGLTSLSLSLIFIGYEILLKEL